MLLQGQDDEPDTEARLRSAWTAPGTSIDDRLCESLLRKSVAVSVLAAGFDCTLNGGRKECAEVTHLGVQTQVYKIVLCLC
jgi:hypothetical protein